MKKILLTFVSCLMALGAYAGAGDMAAGGHLGVASMFGGVTNFGIGAKFQYGITDPLRAEASLNYWFKDSGWHVFDFDINAHYIVYDVNKIKAYPIVGIGYSSVGWSDSYSYDGGDYGEDVGAPKRLSRSSASRSSSSSSNGRFLFNLGIGGEYELTDNLSLDAELKYQYMKNYARLPITIGVIYHF